MIEYILHPIVVKYCQNGTNEYRYCRNSTHYLLELDQWKPSNLDIQNKLFNKSVFNVAADVVALCPDIKSSTLRNTLTTALNLQFKFCELDQRFFVEIFMLRLL